MVWKVVSIQERTSQEKGTKYYVFEAHCYIGDLEDGRADIELKSIIYFPGTGTIAFPYKWAGRNKKLTTINLHKKHMDSLLQAARDAVESGGTVQWTKYEKS